MSSRAILAPSTPDAPSLPEAVPPPSIRHHHPLLRYVLTPLPAFALFSPHWPTVSTHHPSALSHTRLTANTVRSIDSVQLAYDLTLAEVTAHALCVLRSLV